MEIIENVIGKRKKENFNIFFSVVIMGIHLHTSSVIKINF